MIWDEKAEKELIRLYPYYKISYIAWRLSVPLRQVYDRVKELKDLGLLTDDDKHGRPSLRSP